MRRQGTHTAPTGALCGGRVRIELRPELYAYGTVCVFIQPRHSCSEILVMPGKMHNQ